MNEKTSKAEKDIDYLRFYLKTYVYSEFANKYNDKYPADGIIIKFISF